MANVPDFKQGFSYSNVGLVVGTINYAKPILNKQGETFGYEFLINARGFGSVNAKYMIIEKAQHAFDSFPVSEKPRVRVNLAKLQQYTNNQGRIYTNVMSLDNMYEAKTIEGEDMPDGIKGRLSGEVFGIRMDGNIVKFKLACYDVDKEGKRYVHNNGNVNPPEVIDVEVHDPELISRVQNEVRDGINVEVGYYYINKNDISYDEFGMPEGSGERIEYVEVKKLVVKNLAAPQQTNPFGQNPQQQNQPTSDPFAGAGRQLPNDNNLAQQAQNVFGNNQSQQGGFPFGS